MKTQFPGTTMGISNEKKGYGQILKKLPYGYMSFKKKSSLKKHIKKMQPHNL
jgi:hypothetical protein